MAHQGEPQNPLPRPVHGVKSLFSKAQQATLREIVSNSLTVGQQKSPQGFYYYMRAFGIVKSDTA